MRRLVPTDVGTHAGNLTTRALDASACDLEHAALLQPDPTGSGSGSIKIVVGKVGTGTCDGAHPDCVIVVNDGGSLDPAASVRIPVTFAGG